LRNIGLLYPALLLLACGSNSPHVTATPTRDGELPAAKEAYSAYCGLCPKSAACCLKEADFADTRWSPAAGAYLRALREHYECMRGDSLIDASLYADPFERPALGRHQAPVESSMSYSCEKHACMASGEAMAAELDRALVRPEAHPKGASLVCGP
jgi:hypothetical protein